MRDEILASLEPSTGARIDDGKPRASLARFASQIVQTPAAWAPVLPEGARPGETARAWRIADAVFALWDEFYVLADRFVPLPPDEADAERVIRSLEGDAEALALAVSATLELSVVLTEEEVLCATEDTRVHERWRTPWREDETLTFVAATRQVPTGNELLELEVDLEHGWVDATVLGKGWKTMPAFGIHSAPPPPRRPPPEQAPRRAGWLARLLGR
jgi:hypothetical protein